MPRRILEGQVVSDKTDKTITVLVERRYMHPIYKKYLKKSKKFTAHDAANTFKTGDRVQIIECAPISKTKRWTVLTDAEAQKSTDEKKTKDVAAKKSDAEKADAKKTEKKASAEKKAPAKKAAAKKPAAKKPAAKKTTAKKETKKDK